MLNNNSNILNNNYSNILNNNNTLDIKLDRYISSRMDMIDNMYLSNNMSLKYIINLLIKDGIILC